MCQALVRNACLEFACISQGWDILQSAVSAAVMPLWGRPELAATSPEVAQRLVSILAKCTNGTATVSSQGAARAGLRAAFQPEPSTVQQIVEMGFSHARAEEALRRVRITLFECTHLGMIGAGHCLG